MPYFRKTFQCHKSIHWLVLSSTLVVASCSTTAKLDDEQNKLILDGQNGGLVLAFDKIDGVPCTMGSMTFKNLDTQETVKGNYTFGLFGTKSSTNIVPATPGRYVPVSGGCRNYSESGGYRRTTSYNFQVSDTGNKPVVVKSGLVTVPGTYQFKGKRFLKYTIDDDAAKLKSKMESKYSDLNFELWETP